MFFLLGLKAGFIIAVTLLPGAIRIAKLGAHGQRAGVLVVSLALLLGQAFWFLVGGAGIFLMLESLPVAGTFLEGFSAFVLSFIAYRYLGAPRAQSLALEPTGSLRSIFVLTLIRGIAMPIRLPLTIAVFVAVGTHLRYPGDFRLLPDLWAGAVVGAAFWWVQLALLAVVFAPRVPESITLRSLNRLRPFSAGIFFLLACLNLLFLFG